MPSHLKLPTGQALCYVFCAKCHFMEFAIQSGKRNGHINTQLQ